MQKALASTSINKYLIFINKEKLPLNNDENNYLYKVIKFTLVIYNKQQYFVLFKVIEHIFIERKLSACELFAPVWTELELDLIAYTHDNTIR